VIYTTGGQLNVPVTQMGRLLSF